MGASKAVEIIRGPTKCNLHNRMLFFHYLCKKLCSMILAEKDVVFKYTFGVSYPECRYVMGMAIRRNISFATTWKCLINMNRVFGFAPISVRRLEKYEFNRAWMLYSILSLWCPGPDRARSFREQAQLAATEDDRVGSGGLGPPPLNGVLDHFFLR